MKACTSLRNTSNQYVFCVLVLCVGSVCWFRALVLCVGSVHWFCGFVCWFFVLVLCAYGRVRSMVRVPWQASFMTCVTAPDCNATALLLFAFSRVPTQNVEAILKGRVNVLM